MAELNLCSSESYALMDSGAIPNVFSKTMAERLCVKPEHVPRTVTVSTGDNSAVLGIIAAVLVAFVDMVVNLDLIVGDGSPFDVIIGDPAMEDLHAIINIGKRTVRFTREAHTIERTMEPDYSRAKEYNGSTDSEVFKSDSSTILYSSSEYDPG